MPYIDNFDGYYEESLETVVKVSSHEERLYLVLFILIIIIFILLIDKWSKE